jgi:hypothetical protein
LLIADSPPAQNEEVTQPSALELPREDQIRTPSFAGIGGLRVTDADTAGYTTPRTN